jgi:ribosomal protein S18 acetylase RimI-like enzyme
MMGSIVKAAVQDIPLLSEIATISFIESHGNSAEAKDIDNYVTEKYSVSAFREELSEEKNIYHIIYHNGRAAGYSKIVFNTPFSDSMIKNIAKLERLYLLKNFYDLKLGAVLFQFNVDLSKKNNQAGIWLYTWKENHRAINFYKKYGFEIIGSYDFAISATHSNPNHQMFLKF